MRRLGRRRPSNNRSDVERNMLNGPLYDELKTLELMLESAVVQQNPAMIRECEDNITDLRSQIHQNNKTHRENLRKNRRSSEKQSVRLPSSEEIAARRAEYEQKLENAVDVVDEHLVGEVSRESVERTAIDYGVLPLPPMPEPDAQSSHSHGKIRNDRQRPLQKSVIHVASIR